MDPCQPGGQERHGHGNPDNRQIEAEFHFTKKVLYTPGMDGGLPRSRITRPHANQDEIPPNAQDETEIEPTAPRANPNASANTPRHRPAIKPLTPSSTGNRSRFGLNAASNP